MTHVIIRSIIASKEMSYIRMPITPKEMIRLLKKNGTGNPKTGGDNR